MFDPLRFAMAMLPLAAYANVLGLLRLRRCPTVLSGAVDFVLLGLALVGIVAIGPMELFFPRAAYSLLGGWVWIILIALYFFMVMLIALHTPPHIVVYGLDLPELKQIVQQVLLENQLKSDWLGNLVEIHDLGVRANLDSAGKASISQIQSAGKEQSLQGWFTLEQLIVQKTSAMALSHRRQGWIWLSTSLLMFGLAAVLMASDLPRLQQAMTSFFGND